MLDAIYYKQLEDKNLQIKETYLNGDKNDKVVEITNNSTTFTKNGININKVKERIKKEANHKKKKTNVSYDEDKTLIETILHIEDHDPIEAFKKDTKEIILYDFDYYKIFNEIKPMTFEREKITNYKSSSNNTYLNQLFNALIVNKNIYYPILKLNKMIDNLQQYIRIAHNLIKTSNYLIPRTELYLMNTNYDFIEINSPEKIKKIIEKAKVKPIEMFLYAFQQVLTSNEKVLGMSKYDTQNVYETTTDFTANYLYYSTDTHILRFKLIYIITLEKNKLPFTDLNYYLFKIKWNKQSPITTDSNFLVILKLDVFFRNTKLLELQHDFKAAIKSSVKTERPIHHNLLQNVYYDLFNEPNLHHNIKSCLAQPNAALYIKEIVLSDKIKNMLDRPKMSQAEIDNMFNPKQVETDQTEPITNNIICSSDEDDEEEYEITEPLQKPINTTQSFKLIFKYNKNYYFNNDEKYIIQNAYITKYTTNKKLRILTDEYEIVIVIKPTNKNYTDIKYFNFILTTQDYKYFTNQYHAYLDKTNNITNITEITHKINNII
jgi:hypothetical protein